MSCEYEKNEGGHTSYTEYVPNVKYEDSSMGNEIVSTIYIVEDE